MKLLAHLFPSRPIGVVNDASAVDLQAVLVHHCKNGNEIPIGNAPKTLTEAQQNYGQT